MSEADNEFFADLKRSVGWVGGTLNANVKTPDDQGAAQDFDGNLLIAPWMKTWGAKWVTTTNPLTRKALFEWASLYVKAGVDSIQFDDPLLQLHSADWGGGDFSQTSLSGFREFLQRYPNKNELASIGIVELSGFDYKEYLRKNFNIQNSSDYFNKYRHLPTTNLWIEYLTDSVRSFLSDLRYHLDTIAGRRVPLSMNLAGVNGPNGSNRQFFLTEFADYVIAETPINNDADIHSRVATFRALGIGHIPSFAPSSVGDGRKAISTFYALGSNPLVPWDVYVHKGVGKPTRYFGKFEEFGDLYHFVRSNTQLFDQWELTPVVGIVVPINTYREKNTMTLVQNLVSSRVPFAFVLTAKNNRALALSTHRIKHIGMLITANPISDFSQDERDLLQSSGIAVFDNGEASKFDFESLSPFFRTSSEDNLTLIPRARAEQEHQNELLVHVIGDATHKVANNPFCSRSVGIKSSALTGRQPKKTTWLTTNAAAETARWHKVPQGFKIELPTCVEWGIIHIELDR